MIKNLQRFFDNNKWPTCGMTDDHSPCVTICDPFDGVTQQKYRSVNKTYSCHTLYIICTYTQSLHCNPPTTL